MKIKSFFVGLLVFGMTATVPMVVTSCKEENVVASSDAFSKDVLNDDAADAAKCPICNNCVYYVRCKIKTLPGGLTSYQSKKNIINASSPVAGYAAIMPAIDSKYKDNGHIAYVEKVNSDGTINISEGSSGGTCTTRNNRKPTDLKIDGYYKP